MNYLLDTNVLSELRKGPSRIEPSVQRWAASQNPSRLFISAITVFELELGTARLRRRDELQARRLDTWIREQVLDVFAGRVLPVDVAVARRAALLHVPDPRPEADALIAATAAVNDLVIVTRNVKDFESVEVGVFNPWP